MYVQDNKELAEFNLDTKVMTGLWTLDTGQIANLEQRENAL